MLEVLNLGVEAGVGWPQLLAEDVFEELGDLEDALVGDDAAFAMVV